MTRLRFGRLATRGLWTGAAVGLALAFAGGALAQSPADPNAAAQPDEGDQPATPPSTPRPFAPPRITSQPLRDDQVALIMHALDDADSHGFKHGVFATSDLYDRLRARDPTVRQGADIEMRRDIVAYARAQHGLRLSPAAFPKNWGMKPAPYDAVSDFNFAVNQDRIGPWLDSLPPPFDRYRSLRSALTDYRAIDAAGGWGVVPSGPTLRKGAHGERVRAVRARLAAEDPSTVTDATSSTYDDDLETAVLEFQRRYGLTPTGAVDAATLRAMNTPVVDRILTIEANMERWRWAPRIWPTTRIEVNIPAQELDAVRDNAIMLEMRAAPGRPTDQTPMLASQIQSIVLDPPWNVPSSIATKELWPKEHAHHGYLESHGYRLIPVGDAGGVRIQQKYGPKSALGSIKFDFPNNYSVYLHDTPSRRAFSSTSRAVSHGCVRLQRPIDLAALLFDSDPDWTKDHIRDVIAEDKTIRVALPSPMPVFLMYWTAFTDVKHRVNFRSDVYGWDTDLQTMLAGRSPAPTPSDATDEPTG